MKKSVVVASLLLAAACGQPAEEAALPEDVRDGVRFTVAGIHRAEQDQVRLVRAEAVAFPDGCLGIPMREYCAEVVVPGYRYRVAVEGMEYEYRAPQTDPLALVLAASPEPDEIDPVLVYEAYEGRCISLQVSAEGQGAAGPCDAPHLARPLLNETRRRAEWNDLVQRFAPFRYEPHEQGVLVTLDGRGAETASPAWQRAVLAWAGVVYAEQASGRSGASWGTAFAREHPAGGDRCETLVVERYAVAFASRARCGGGAAEDVGGGWLTDAEWAAFDRWHETYAPAEAGAAHFFGAGMTPMPPDTLAALDAWAAAVYARLAGAP